MLDEYIWGHVNRISPEAPVMVIDAQRQSSVPGGAANVVNNLCALGAIASIVGTAGSDTYGDDLVAALAAEGAETSGIIRLEARPTTRKTRIIAHSQSVNAQVVRVDHEDRSPLSRDVEEKIISQMERLIPSADAVLLSDYQKGVLGTRVLQECLKLIKPGQPVTGNLKPAAFGALGRPRGLTVLTMNVHEASVAVGKSNLSEMELIEAGRQIVKTTACKYVLITQGSNGLTLFSEANPEFPIRVPPRQVEVYDSAGAGDTVISTLTLALASGASPEEAVRLANFAAAETVKKVGVATVSPAEILAAVASDVPADGGC
jgi:D-beta-D-heptose 7-phosphate kinase/D-beta-D-heptose 1-phosphate adenosyltransferase